jgi:hypothetical protein
MATKYDIALFQGKLDGTVQTQKVGGYRTKTAKLLQRCVNCLLQQRGSMMHDPEWGTDFLSDLWDGNLDEATIRPRFYVAARQLRAAIRATEKPTDDPDERLDDLNLASFTIEGDSLQLTLEVKALSGATSSDTADAPLRPFPG